MRRLSPRTLDWLLLVLIAAINLASLLIGEIPGEEAGFRPFDTLAAVFLIAQIATLYWRSTNPDWALVAWVALWAVDRWLNNPPNSGATVGMILIYAVGAYLPTERARLFGITGFTVVIGWTAYGAATVDTVGAEELLSVLLFSTLPFFIGREIRQRREQLALAEERAERAERLRELRAEEAVSAERSRIARELHDVVSHQLAVITVQSEGARRLAAGSDERVAKALHTITKASHEALSEMRRMVGVLKSEGDDPSALAPLPSLDDLERLAGQMEAAGLPVDLSVEGDTSDLPEGIALNSYRIVQEALTNSLRHAGPGARASVAISRSDHEVYIDVTDDGRGAAVAPSEGGHGLIGMRERVSLLEGSMEAGPRPGGGYGVQIRIPIPA